jgi:hypothetical protein
MDRSSNRDCSALMTEASEVLKFIVHPLRDRFPIPWFSLFPERGYNNFSQMSILLE